MLLSSKIPIGRASMSLLLAVETGAKCTENVPLEKSALEQMKRFNWMWFERQVEEDSGQGLVLSILTPYMSMECGERSNWQHCSPPFLGMAEWRSAKNRNKGSGEHHTGLRLTCPVGEADKKGTHQTTDSDRLLSFENTHTLRIRFIDPLSVVLSVCVANITQ
jgi:hypothetical protein